MLRTLFSCRVKIAAVDAGWPALSLQTTFVYTFRQFLLKMKIKNAQTLRGCRLNLVISSKWHIVEMFKVDIHMRNSAADVSKTISQHKMLHYKFLIDITVNNYNLPQSKGGVFEYHHFFCFVILFVSLLRFIGCHISS